MDSEKSVPICVEPASREALQAFADLQNPDTVRDTFKVTYVKLLELMEILKIPLPVRSACEASTYEITMNVYFKDISESNTQRILATIQFHLPLEIPFVGRCVPYQEAKENLKMMMELPKVQEKYSDMVRLWVLRRGEPHFFNSTIHIQETISSRFYPSEIGIFPYRTERKMRCHPARNTLRSLKKRHAFLFTRWMRFLRGGNREWSGN